MIEYATPQVAGRGEPWRSQIRDHLKGHTQALEDLSVEESRPLAMLKTQRLIAHASGMKVRIR